MRLPLAIAVAVVFCNAALLARATDVFEAQHQRVIAANPAGLHLRISLEGEQNRFRIGDTIKLQYEFTADAPGEYVAGARANDSTCQGLAVGYRLAFGNLGCATFLPSEAG